MIDIEQLQIELARYKAAYDVVVDVLQQINDATDGLHYDVMRNAVSHDSVRQYIDDHDVAMMDIQVSISKRDDDEYARLFGWMGKGDE